MILVNYCAWKPGQQDSCPQDTDGLLGKIGNTLKNCETFVGIACAEALFSRVVRNSDGTDLPQTPAQAEPSPPVAPSHLQ